jgi:hypothetical protein
LFSCGGNSCGSAGHFKEKIVKKFKKIDFFEKEKAKRVYQSYEVTFVKTIGFLFIFCFFICIY